MSFDPSAAQLEGIPQGHALWGGDAGEAMKNK